MTRSATPFRSAFTLVELLIVLVIIAVLVGIAVPRFSGNTQRAAILAAEQTADLLTLLAHRDSMGETDVAISYEDEYGEILLLKLQENPEDPEGPRIWWPDRYVPPVRLPEGMKVVNALEDNRPVSGRDWFIPLVAGRERPRIELELASDDLVIQVLLPPYALSAMVLQIDEEEAYHRLPIDLDTEGDSREAWR